MAGYWRCHTELAYREWDGEFVVYNEDDGNTHHLGGLGSALMSALLNQNAPQDVASLITSIMIAEDWATRPSLRQVEDALDELARLGLVVREPP